MDIEKKELSEIAKQALHKIRRLTAELKAEKDKHSEPIAIVGIGCRFSANVNCPDEFWQLVQSGKTVVDNMPDSQLNTSQTKQSGGNAIKPVGCFIESIDRFDASFFSIDAYDANAIDPQRRLLFECAWHAFEDASIVINDSNRHRIGIYVGQANQQYQYNGQPGHDAATNQTISHYNRNTIAEHLASVLACQGPALTLSNVHAASLVALHIACQSLRSSECDIALAAGVNLALAEMSDLINDNCENDNVNDSISIDEMPVYGDGCGVLILRRLSDALKAKDPILAIIKGSAISNSSGYPLYKDVYENVAIKALERAQVSPENVSYLETTTFNTTENHNALTSINDIVQSGNSNHLLHIGSLKNSIGDTGAVAGIAGVIKAVLSLKNNAIAANMHFSRLKNDNPLINSNPLLNNNPLINSNPLINDNLFKNNNRQKLSEWQALKQQTEQDKYIIDFSDKLIDWSKQTMPRVAIVSAISSCSTNACIVIVDLPARENIVAEIERAEHILTLSAKSKSALNQLIRQYQGYLAKTNYAIGDICHTANTGRALFPYRIAFSALTVAELQETLTNYRLNQQPEPEAEYINDVLLVQSPPCKLVWFFNDINELPHGITQTLYETQANYRQYLDNCAKLLANEIEVPLIDLLWGSSSDLLKQQRYAQPALLALQYSMGRLYQHWGIWPDTVFGHGVGEYAAACLSGVFSLQEAFALLTIRARLLDECYILDKKVILFASLQKKNELIEGLYVYSVKNELNESYIVCGSAADITTFTSRATQAQVEIQHLTSMHENYNELMHQLLKPFQQAAKKIKYQQPAYNYISGLNGAYSTNEMASASYWLNHIVTEHHTEQGLTLLKNQTIEYCLELGPSSTINDNNSSWQATKFDYVSQWLPTMKSGCDWQVISDSLKYLYQAGYGINWHRFDIPYLYQKVKVPNYPFENQCINFNEQLTNADRHNMDRRNVDRNNVDTDNADALFQDATDDDNLSVTDVYDEIESKQGIQNDRHEHKVILCRYLHQQFAFLLQLPLNQISLKDKIYSLGFSSTMMFELDKRVQLAFKTSLPESMRSDDLTIEDLVDYLFKENHYIIDETFDVGEIQSIDVAENLPLLGAVQTLSEENAYAMLLDLLDK